METNKLFWWYTEVYVYVFPVVLVFYKMNMFLLLVVGWSADRWSVDLAPFWCRDFAILILIFFVLTIKKKQIWLLEAITIPFLKIYKYFNFKRKKPRVYCNFIQYFFYLLEIATDVPKSTPCYRILLSELLHRYFL